MKIKCILYLYFNRNQEGDCSNNNDNESAKKNDLPHLVFGKISVKKSKMHVFDHI